MTTEANEGPGSSGAQNEPADGDRAPSDWPNPDVPDPKDVNDLGR